MVLYFHLSIKCRVNLLNVSKPIDNDCGMYLSCCKAGLVPSTSGGIASAPSPAARRDGGGGRWGRAGPLSLWAARPKRRSDPGRQSTMVYGISPSRRASIALQHPGCPPMARRALGAGGPRRVVAGPWADVGSPGPPVSPVSPMVLVRRWIL